MAAVKFATLSRQNSPKDAAIIRDALLADPRGEQLCRYLDRSGIDYPARFIEYAPEIFEKLILTKKTDPKSPNTEEHLRLATKQAIELFFKIYDKAEPYLDGKKATQLVIGGKAVSNFITANPQTPTAAPIEFDAVDAGLKIK